MKTHIYTISVEVDEGDAADLMEYIERALKPLDIEIEHGTTVDENDGAAAAKGE